MISIFQTSRKVVHQFKILQRLLSINRNNCADSKTSESNSISRGVKILKTDIERLRKGEFGIKEENVFPRHVDVAIIGGGIMGWSIAYWLKKRTHKEGLRIVVIEKDQFYTRSSTILSLGGMRQQFSLPENVQMALFSAAFLRNIKTHLNVLGMEPPDIEFNPLGCLCLASEQSAEQLETNYQMQKDLGAAVELLTSAELKDEFPWLNTEDIALGCYGLENEGWFDPCALLHAFKRKAMSLHTKSLTAEVTGFGYREDFHPMYVRDETGKDHRYQHVEQIKVKTEHGNDETISFAIAVLAAGSQSGAIGNLAKIGQGPGLLRYPIPVEPRKRQVFVYDSDYGPGIGCPLVIDPNGTHFRRVGLDGTFVGGTSPLPNEEPDITTLDVDYSAFENRVWPALVRRVPSFESIKLKNAWAGFYDFNTFDQSGIIGSHPHYPNLYMATGFGDHGIQQAPAVGRAIAELIIDRCYRTLDLSRLGFERILANEPLYETNVY